MYTLLPPPPPPPLPSPFTSLTPGSDLTALALPPLACDSLLAEWVCLRVITNTQTHTHTHTLLFVPSCARMIASAERSSSVRKCDALINRRPLARSKQTVSRKKTSHPSISRVRKGRKLNNCCVWNVSLADKNQCVSRNSHTHTHLTAHVLSSPPVVIHVNRLW